jgi:hypothetical protein
MLAAGLIESGETPPTLGELGVDASHYRRDREAL